MAFTNIWDDNTPAGTIQAKDLDNHIRQHRLDVHERMDSVLTVNWAADPIVLKDNIIGKKSSVARFIDFSQFMTDTELARGYIPDHLNGRATMWTDSGAVVAPLSGVIPVGCVIRNLFWLWDRANAGISITAELRRGDIASGNRNITVLDSILVNSGALGYLLQASNALNIPIAIDKYYYLAIDAAGAGGLGMSLVGCKVVFDRPTTQEAT